MSDVLVIGGGLIGLGIAWRTSQAGLSVTVLDEAPGQGASSVGAGLLAPVTEAHYGEEDLLELTLASARRYPGFVGELQEASDLDAGYRQNGTLVVAKDGDDLAELEELHRHQAKLGLEVERLPGRECRRLEPMLAPSVRGGLLVEGDHQVDTLKLLAALQEACRRVGVAFVSERATRLEGDGRVALSSGEWLEADRVVLAAGAWSGRIEGVPAEAVPVRPVKGQLLHLMGPADFLERNLRGMVRGSGVYLVSRGDGRLVVGATVEEMGFDTSITAGAVYTLLRDAYQLLPGIVELRLTATLAGLRPGTPDNAPLLGEVAPRLVVATGHYRNGILLTPISAEAIAELLVEGKTPQLIEPFSPRRFQEAGA
ncbi:MAG: glycine oxidase ThiO [Actinomycetota bacterium]|nr:glycine oxidase ThiO [Actinomycetota bacterium]